MAGMTGRLEGKVVVVTGGSSGIGRAVAERVAADGAAVVIGARREDVGEEVAAGIRAAGGEARYTRADVTVEADVAALVGAAVDGYGRLDAAFNNAGGVAARGPVQDVGADAWRADLDLNLTSVYYGLKYQLPAMLDGGAVVNNASMGGTTGIAGMAPYVAAKHGVVGLTRSAALECAGRGVRVNALVTGNVDTPLFRGVLGDGFDEGALAALNPTGRIAAPAEVAAFVAFLFSDEARCITGAALAIDGGATA
jgi:NAD(P)-dependent dehydrogenase (short-subunit alcohol dehydrogenase family)